MCFSCDQVIYTIIPWDPYAKQNSHHAFIQRTYVLIGKNNHMIIQYMNYLIRNNRNVIASMRSIFILKGNIFKNHVYIPSLDTRFEVCKMWEDWVGKLLFLVSLSCKYIIYVKIKPSISVRLWCFYYFLTCIQIC